MTIPPSLPKPPEAMPPRVSSRGRLRVWVGGLGLAMSLAGVVAVWLLPGFVASWITREAARHGILLEHCQVDLGFSALRLSGCSFSSLSTPGTPSAFAGLRVAGTARDIEVQLTRLRPSRAVLRALAVEVWGRPALADLLPPEQVTSTPIPIDLEHSALAWHLAEDSKVDVAFSDVGYSTGSESLHALWEVDQNIRGQLTLEAGGLDVTIGPGSPAQAHLVVRARRAERRVEVAIDLQGFPLLWLEGPSLALTDTLRTIELDGRLAMTAPLGLSAELPTGDVSLTLRGLQFPVPRELEGLIHASAPRVYGKLSLNHALDQMRVRELGFLTGQLEMTGHAELDWNAERRGLHFESQMSGPLSCRAIAESAVTARAGTSLGKLAGKFAKQTLTGNVKIVAALSGSTWELPRALVLTSIGVGCGLRPLPIELANAVEILSNLPAEVLRQLPQLQLPTLPKAPGTWPLPPLRTPAPLRTPPRLREAPKTDAERIRN